MKEETKHKDKVGDMTPKKEKMDDSDAAPATYLPHIFDLFNDTDKSRKKNCVKRQSDTFNKSKSSLKTNTEEEHQRKKATNEETAATSKDTVKKAPIMDTTDRKKIKNKKSKSTRLFAKSQNMFMNYQNGMNH